MIQTYPNYLNQYQIIGIGNNVTYQGVYTEIDYIINQYNLTVNNSIAELSVNNDTQLLPINNDIPELVIR